MTFDVIAGKAVATVIPQSRFIKVINRVKVGKKHLWSLATTPGDSEITLTGWIKGPAPSPYSVAVSNPSAVYGRVLAGRIIDAGVGITGQIRRDDAAIPASLKPVCTIKTPLAVAMKRANKRSLNMAAECLLLRAGDGSWPGSARIMADTLAKTFGLQADQLAVADGGGLSRGNRVTAAAMTKLLAQLATYPDARILLNSLSVAGVDGTLRKRLRGEKYKSRVIAKTGRIQGVSCLSGYVLDDQGRVAVAFSILINRLPGRAKQSAKVLQDNICRALVDSL